MAEILTRAEKGAKLTHAELDGNLNELDTRTKQGWNDLVTEVTIRSGSAPVIAQFRDGIYLYSFDAGTPQECFAAFHFRHDYIAGTMVYPHVHWTTNTTNTGTVRWGVEYTLARRHDSTGLRAFGATNTIYIEHNIATPSQYTHFVNESPDSFGIPGTDLEEDSILLCRFFRDASDGNDTFPDAVFLITVDVHYQCNTLCTPSRFPPFV